MGYTNAWEGALHPNSRIPQQVVDRVNALDYDVCVVTSETDDADGDVGDICPTCRTMGGSRLINDICRVQKILDPYKIKLSGEILRTGEAAEDFEKIEVVNGRVYTRSGEITYGPRVRVTLDRWAVKIRTKRKNGESKTCGWLTKVWFPPKTAVMWSTCDDPPNAAARFSSRKEARGEIRALKDTKHAYEIVKTEELG